MDLTAPAFLFLFVPAVFALFFLLPRRARAGILLAASAVFLFVGGLANPLVLAASVAVNFALGKAIEAAPPARRGKILAAGIAVNLLGLIYYKYLGFAAANLGFLAPLGLDALAKDTPLPLGISFFTFQALAYLIDISRGTAPAEKSLSRLALSLAFFPKISAGPIARHSLIAADLAALSPRLEDFVAGAGRFCVGLAKKVLIAGGVAPLANQAFKIAGGQVAGVALDAPTAWIGLAAYTVQIYFDFSGYTDMAVGLGRMFGVKLPENFDYPYRSTTIQEFWRRWHISLSSWFRDYLYIPLGGNRVPPWRIYANLVIVFVLCGLWHGAAWTFVIWGLWHGVFLTIERAGWSDFLKKCPAFVGHLYALLAVMGGWVFFRAASAAEALTYFNALFSFSASDFAYFQMNVVTRQNLFALVLGVVLSAPAVPWMKAKIESSLSPGVFAMARSGLLLALMAAALVQAAAGTEAPFIYAKF